MAAFTAAPTPLSTQRAAVHSRLLHSSRRSRPPSTTRGRRRHVLRALDSSTPASPPPAPLRGGRPPDYHANVGSVIDSLRSFYPQLLTQEPDLTYFSPNVVFMDSTGYRVVGHDAYRTAFWMLRAQARVFFATAAVEIQSLYHDNGAGMIYLRWRLQANPRGWSLLAGPQARRNGCFVIDGMSVYTLDAKGFVAVHQLENTARRRNGLRPMFEDILSVGAGNVGTPVGAGVGVRSRSGLPTWFVSHERAKYSPLQKGWGGRRASDATKQEQLCEDRVYSNEQGVTEVSEDVFIEPGTL